tara:strand:+ start:93 stop:764 length:672 start_codon:yes stop_codon:yes gene_type:complete
MNIFGDAIDDVIFSRKNKRFTTEEKTLIDSFLNTILREDKTSELETSEIKSFNNRADRITEEIYKIFTLKNTKFFLRFYKLYTNEKKIIDWLPSDKFSLSSLVYDGHDSTSGSPTRSLLKDLEDDKSITGIFVEGLAAVPKISGYVTLQFILKSTGHEYHKGTDLLGIRTKYDGSELTNKCKNHIKNVHLKIIKDTIINIIKKRKIPENQLDDELETIFKTTK